MIDAISALARSSGTRGFQPHEAVEEVIDVVLAQPQREPEIAAMRRVELTRRHTANRRGGLRVAWTAAQEIDSVADDGPEGD